VDNNSIPLSAALLLNGNVIVANADQDLTPNDAGANRQEALEIAPGTIEKSRAPLTLAGPATRSDR
jgi:hypothetical protein